MKIIKPSVEFFGPVPTDYDAAIKFIEIAGRTCYKSEDKITPDSAEKFVKRLINAGHLAMVEHSNFVIRAQNELNVNILQGIIGKYLNTFKNSNYTYIGGSLTAWANLYVESQYGRILVPFINVYGNLFNQNIMDLTSSLWEGCPHNEIPKELHRYSARFICDRGVSHELVRHRPCSFAQESTRYVNYCDKEIEFIEPTNYMNWNQPLQRQFYMACSDAEERYKFMLAYDAKPQQARAVLPNALKTEIIVTADIAEWKHIRKLRTSKDAHPDMQRVMNMIPWDDFI